MNYRPDLLLMLSDLLQGEAPSAATTMEQAGDVALVAQDWAKALSAYEQCEESNLRLDEKRGWCLGQSNAWAEALAVLAHYRSTLSSAGLAMLAVASAGGWRAPLTAYDAA